MTRILFLCARNRQRSPTAEQIFSGREGVECASAGLAPDAEEPVTAELIGWADLILVMERRHKRKLSEKFQRYLKGKKVVSLDIADEYDYMEPRLVDLLTVKVAPYLPARVCGIRGVAA